jgi:myosin-1
MIFFRKRALIFCGIKRHAYVQTCIVGDFNRDVVSTQVKYLGLMENLRVRRAGFAYRRLYELFLERYKSLCPETWPKFTAGPPRAGVQIIMEKYTKSPDDYRMGE